MCPEDTGTDGYAYITITPVRAGLGRVFYSELLGGRRVDDDTITAAMHTFSFFTLFVLVHLFYFLISSNSLSLFFYTLISTHLLEQ